MRDRKTTICSSRHIIDANHESTKIWWREETCEMTTTQQQQQHSTTAYNYNNNSKVTTPYHRTKCLCGRLFSFCYSAQNIVSLLRPISIYEILTIEPFWRLKFQLRCRFDLQNYSIYGFRRDCLNLGICRVRPKPLVSDFFGNNNNPS